jgi:hypothetical protein
MALLWEVHPLGPGEPGMDAADGLAHLALLMPGGALPPLPWRGPA